MDSRSTCEVTDKDLGGGGRGDGSLGEHPWADNRRGLGLSVGWASTGLVIRLRAQEPGLGW